MEGSAARHSRLHNGVNGAIHFFSTSPAVDQPARTLTVSRTPISLAEAWQEIDRVLPSLQVAAPLIAQTRATDRSIGVVPQFARMLADDRGRLWLKEYDPATDAIAVGAHRSGGRWLVIDTRGTVVANISLPKGLTPLMIYGDDLLGIARDTMGVQTFVVHRIVR